MTEHPAFRLRIAFEKGPEMRYTGHLDLQRTWERTLRRARLPVAYTQGFNARPRMQLGPALPLGCTSICELIDIWLQEAIEPQILLGKLRAASPPGLIAREVTGVQGKEDALQNQVIAVEYEVQFPVNDKTEQLQTAIETFLGEERVIRIRRGKQYDLRPLVESLECIPDERHAHLTLRMRLTSLEGATGRPEELLHALGADPTQVSITRTRMFFNSID